MSTFIELVMVENAKIAVGISMLSIIVFQTKEISTSGLGGHIAISGCRSYSQSLSLNSPWSKMVQLKMKTVVLLLKQMGFLPQAQHVCVTIEAQHEG